MNIMKDSETEFLEYWDKVVKLWLDKPKGENGYTVIDARRPLPMEEECYYKEEFKVNIENEQLAFFKNEKLSKLLCPAHLPEPYWGDPNKGKCSIVVVNYNPAGGKDMNPHSYKGTITTDGTVFPPNTIIDYVKKHSYSELAKGFPIWKGKLPKGLEWLCSYGGRKWWLGKKEWIHHLVGTEINVEEFPPFAIELCGWHSPYWPDNTKVFMNINIKAAINSRFSLPLLNAIDNSISKLAICIGAQFKPSILREFLPGLEDITECVFNELKGNNSGIEYHANLASAKDDDMSISVTVKAGKKNTTRYYRVYNVKEKDNNHIILNTFAPGSNHHPAKAYWEFENELIKAIKGLKLEQEEPSSTHSVKVETTEELEQIRSAEDIIKKYRENPTGDLAHLSFRKKVT